MHKKEEERNKRVKDRVENLERKKEEEGIRKKRKTKSKHECDSGHAPISYSLLSLKKPTF